MGSEKRLRPNYPDSWVWSAETVQEPLIDQASFDAVQERLDAGKNAPVQRRRSTPRPYVLRGLVTWARCGKRLEGTWRHNRAYYLCRLADPAEYARSDQLEAEHPRYAYLREDHVIGHVDRWLAQLFDPDQIDSTLAQLLDAGQTDPGIGTRIAAARRRIAEAETKIERYRVALETGGDAKLINQWIAEAQGTRLAAETELATYDQPEPVTADDITQLIDGLYEDWGNMENALNAADPQHKSTLLTSLGVTVSYDPAQRTARVTCTPRVREKSCRRGDSAGNPVGHNPRQPKVPVPLRHRKGRKGPPRN